jgi:hypothetical protein
MFLFAVRRNELQSFIRLGASGRMPTELDAAKVEALVSGQLAEIKDARRLHEIRSLLIHPRCEQRGWDYGSPGQTFPCWFILESRTVDVGIAYCDQGFGPAQCWGLMFLSGPRTSMGMESSWHRSLEEAYLDML